MKQFNAPILFSQDVLGKEYPVKIAGDIGRICLPILDRTAIGNCVHDLKAPLSYVTGGLSSLYHDSTLLDWGYPFMMPSGESLVRLFLFEFNLSPIRDEARTQISKIESHFDRWFDDLRDWLEVLTKQDLAIGDPVLQTKKRGNYLWTIHDGESWSATTVGATMHVSSPALETAISTTQWERAIAHADASRRPQEPHLLLRDARARLRRSHEAYAVIIAATACEIVITQEVDRRLKRTRVAAEFIDELLERPGLTRLINYGRKLGMGFPAGIERQLIKKRNDAVHGNSSISREETKSALAIANQVVETLSLLS